MYSIVHSFYSLHVTASTSNFSAQICFLHAWLPLRGLEHRRVMAAWRAEINGNARQISETGDYSRNSLNRNKIWSKEWYISNSSGKGFEAGSSICSRRGGMILCYSVSAYCYYLPWTTTTRLQKSTRYDGLSDFLEFSRCLELHYLTTTCQI